ncbi:hypothetical protein AKO1_011776 [Acrasis kona]|uniref:Thioredoxin domain-containing protein n=1 Tax=Acrasis kona TaxID=1008807 RepID=A0AAW2Z6P0_9EUKA
MSYSSLSILILLLCIISFSSQSEILEKAQARAFDKEQFLIKIRNINDYNKVFGEKDRANIVVFLTVGQDRIAQCPYCTVFRKVLILLAKKEVPKNSYRAVPLHFAFLEIDQETQQVAQRLGASHVPSMFLLNEESKTPITCDLSKQQIQDFIKQHTGYDDVDLTPEEISSVMQDSGVPQQNQPQGQPTPQIDFSVFKSVWAIGALLLSGIAIFYGGVFMLHLNRTTILTALSFIVLGASIGGTVYNMINNPPPFHYNPYNKELVIFYPEMRAQLVVEGYLSAAVMLVAAAAFIAITEYAPYVQDGSKFVSFFALIILFFGSFFALTVFFIFKSPSYLYDTPFAVWIQIINSMFSK